MEGGKWVDGVCEMDREVSTPSFKKIDDIRNGFKSPQFIVQPIFFKDDEIVMAIQCEARFNKNIKKYSGFQVSDEQILKTFCFYL